MQFNRTQEFTKIGVSPCRTIVTGEAPSAGVILHLDEMAHVVMTVGEAQKLVADINGAISKTAQAGTLLACEICEKPANTVKHGKGYCDDHARGLLA